MWLQLVLGFHSVRQVTNNYVFYREYYETNLRMAWIPCENVKVYVTLSFHNMSKLPTWQLWHVDKVVSCHFVMKWQSDFMSDADTKSLSWHACFEFFAQNFHDMSPSFHNKNQRRFERRGTDSAGLRTPDSQGVLSTLLTMIVACCGDSHVSGRHLPPPDSTPWLMGSVALKLIRSAAVEVSYFLWYPIMGSVIRMVFP